MIHLTPPSAPHVIRLRGPWDIQPLARTTLQDDGTTTTEPGSLPLATQTEVPADWSVSLGEDFRGQVRYTRRFGRPSNLLASEKISLVIEQVDWIGEATLNGQILGQLKSGDPPACFEITSLLEFRNELVIDIALPRSTPQTAYHLDRGNRDGMPGGLVGEVRLEIYSVD